jgi:hypothetical protein
MKFNLFNRTLEVPRIGDVSGWPYVSERTCKRSIFYGGRKMKEIKKNWDRALELTDNINRAAWKLQGIAGILFIEEEGRTISLNEDQANGLSFLLESLAEDIKTNANLITEVTA